MIPIVPTVDRLRAWAIFLEGKAKADAFYDANWPDAWDADRSLYTGAVVCALGWLPATFPQDWAQRHDARRRIVTPILRKTDNADPWVYADFMEWFGLTYEDFCKVTNPREYKKKGVPILPVDVIQRIREIADRVEARP